MGEKLLYDKQKRKLGELLSDAIKNKEMPHELDLGRAALIIYDVTKLDYNLDESEIDEIIEDSGETYSDTTIEDLKNMADAYHSLVFGMKEGFRRLEESDLE